MGKAKGDKKPESLNIGESLRRLRKQAGLSLGQLSKLSGVSKAMLSQIEQNRANPTVAVMCKIARAMNVDIVDLIGFTAKKPRFQVIRREDEKYTFLRDPKCTLRTLSPLSLEKDIEFYEVILQPGGVLNSEPHFKNTEELLTVARGKVKVSSADQSIVLMAGDSAYYSADVEHSVKNIGTSVACVYIVVKYKTD